MVAFSQMAERYFQIRKRLAVKVFKTCVMCHKIVLMFREVSIIFFVKSPPAHFKSTLIVTCLPFYYKEFAS